MSRYRHSFQSNLAARSGKKRPTGVSLVELMTVMGLLSLIFGVLISLVSHSSALVSQGTQVIALNQKARGALDSMAPYVATAINNAGSPAIVNPREKTDAPTAADLISYQSIQFTTTENFLDPDYNPRSDWDTGTRPVFFYEIYFDNTSDPIPYQLEDGTNINLGRILMRRYTTETFGTVDTAVSPKPIAFNVQYFSVHRLRADSIEAKVHTVGKRKGPAGNRIDMFEKAQGILSVPSPSYI